MNPRNIPPQKRSDTITQLILDWDNWDESNPYVTIQDAIQAWECDVNSEDEYTEADLVTFLYEKHQYEWNDGYKRGKSFLQLNEINYEIINAIEDLYIQYEWEFGDELNKNTLEDKLDIIYYFQAKEKLQEALEEHELDNANWG
tara:strand:- start:810 stop:1241 length:432 start_codon:yes stop_codon:yes gene_type:complete